MSIYNNIYQLITDYIYGGNVVTGSFEELTTVLVSTVCCIFAFALPFIIIYKIISRFI